MSKKTVADFLSILTKNLDVPSVREFGLDNPRLEAELILAFVLKINRTKIYTDFSKQVSSSEENALKSVIYRRLKGEPLAYIVGEKEFYSLPFFVNTHTLIPRSDTEILVEEVLKNKPTRILDLCTGSGCIAISLAKNLPNSEVIGVDISQQALKIAEQNAKRNDVNNILFCEGDLSLDKFWSEPYLTSHRFDAIVSNPPYLNDEEFQGISISVKNYEPKEALVAKNDGLFFYEKILRHAKNLLKKDGMVFFEVSPFNHKKVAKIFLEQGFSEVKLVYDYSSKERVLLASN